MLHRESKVLAILSRSKSGAHLLRHSSDSKKFRNCFNGTFSKTDIRASPNFHLKAFCWPSETFRQKSNSSCLRWRCDRMRSQDGAALRKICQTTAGYKASLAAREGTRYSYDRRNTDRSRIQEKIRLVGPTKAAFTECFFFFRLLLV